MLWWQITILVLVGLVGLIAAASVVARLGAVRAIPPGDEAEGLAVFCGGLRWFGGRWGLRSVPAGLSKAGFRGRVEYWQWHEAWRGWLVLPALANRPLIEREAKKAAEYIEAYRHRHPESPVYVLGCSAGGFVALRCLELLAGGVKVQSAALLSPAFDPGRDLAPALSHMEGKLIISSSRLDWIILGLGTLALGAADGKRCCAVGMVGPSDTHAGRVLALRWRAKMFLSGRLGGHASATPPAFLTRYIAPEMGIGRESD